MRFLRTASTTRLLAALAGITGAIAAVAAIAVAATTSTTVPRRQPLAQSLHAALTAKPVGGFFANINFTNSLISSTDFTGGARDPILQGASGRIWISGTGEMRLELQTTNGDAEALVHNHSFWISDPMSKTVYEGTLSSHAHSASTTQPQTTRHTVPTVSQLQADINTLMGHAVVGGATTSDPTNVGGQPAYSVSLKPRHDGGLLGSIQLAWDAVRGVPLQIQVYAAGNATPVLGLTASNISYGPSALAGRPFSITPPGNYTMVKIATPPQTASGPAGKAGAHKSVTGVAAVRSHLPFRLAAPSSLAGLQRQDAKLLDWGGHPAALVTYGQGLGGIAVIEQTATSPSAAVPGQTSGHGPSLSLPTVTINGASGTELATPLGTVLRYTKGGVTYTLLGSVPASAATVAAQSLTP